MAVITMSVTDWVAVPDNPRQRNTIERAATASAAHLSEYSPLHEFVYAATIDNDIVCKLDGHTRAYLWKEGTLTPPPKNKVTVLTVAVASMEEAKTLYDQLDSSKALKRPRDEIYGACREERLQLTSLLLRNCTFSAQLHHITRDGVTRDRYELVKLWKRWLQQLDNLQLTSKYKCLVGFFLVAIRLDGIEVAGKFAKSLDGDEGLKDSRGADGVEALRQHVENRRAAKTLAGWENWADILYRSWSAYSAWKDGKRVKQLKATTSVDDIIASFKTTGKVKA